MKLLVFSLFSLFNIFLSQEITNDYPSLPTMWVADTIEPGAPGGGKGVESYMFVDTPTEDNPSALWSNYTDCQRLIYVPNTYDSRRYLLGCDAVDCCWEEQSSNHVEFQIPNVHYTNPKNKVDVYWQTTNVTNFGEIIEADEWSWSWKVGNVLSQDWRAYTLPCEMCVNGIQLIQWQSRASGSPWFAVQFNNYRGIDPATDEGLEFKTTFNVPDICQRNNLLECNDGIHDKYFNDKSVSGPDCGSCGTAYQTCCIGFAIDGYPCDCHLQEGGDGKTGSNCGDCGTGFSACCIGYAADGYPCQCDVM